MQYTKNELNNVENILQNNIIDFCFKSECEDDTKKLAYSICKYLNNNSVVVLNGELGSGKTAFMYGVAKYFNIEDQICSPTFTIVNEYVLKSNNKIFHFDVYRLNDSIEFDEQIGTEYFSNGICFIEWGNIIQDILPKDTLYIDISKDENNYNTRYIHVWRK